MKKLCKPKSRKRLILIRLYGGGATNEDVIAVLGNNKP